MTDSGKLLAQLKKAHGLPLDQVANPLPTCPQQLGRAQSDKPEKGEDRLADTPRPSKSLGIEAILRCRYCQGSSLSRRGDLPRCAQISSI